MIASKWRRLEFIPSEEDSNIRELKVIACEEYKYDKELGRYVKVTGDELDNGQRDSEDNK